MSNPQTLLGVLNRVLTSLRQTTISSGTTQITDPYQLVLLEFFNQVREEVEDACNWRALWKTVTVTIPANSYFAVIPGTNERSRLIRLPAQHAGNMVTAGLFGAPVAASDRLVPLVFDVTSPSTTGNLPLDEMSLPALQYMIAATNTQKVAQPQAFAIGQSNADNSDAGNSEAVLYVYPAVNNQRSVQITMCVPEADYSTTDVSRNIYVPSLPIIHALQWMAREERGEELGPQGIYTEERYRTTLDNHVGREIAEQGDTLDCVLV